ncbi:MAG: hypothetical protein LUG21_08865, partial [Clostridiales bacterium]|nr:hypothetical protein [Clostridiales bacterium]
MKILNNLKRFGKNVSDKAVRVMLCFLMAMSVLANGYQVSAATVTATFCKDTEWINQRAITTKQGHSHSASTHHYEMATGDTDSGGDILYCIECGSSLPGQTAMHSSTSASALFTGTSVGGTTAAEKMELVSMIGGRSDFYAGYE